MIQLSSKRLPGARVRGWSGFWGLALTMLWPLPILAQTMVPSGGGDGTGTLVVPAGGQLEIRGGLRSQDGKNLFHSFQQFGLSQGQIANFLATPELSNILTRVVGGDASVIDGLLRVTGGQANLYLLNPAGIVFGTQARLDVPAAFTATTAGGLGFSQGGWLNAIGPNNYAALVGTPDRLAFATTQPGAIANFGNLSLRSGQTLSLLGGTVLNIGTLSAPGGQIILAAVPGQTLVRLSQPDHLLSLEFQPLPASVSAVALPFTPLSLPQLLTGGGLGHASGVSVFADGTIQLTGSEARIATAAGTAIVQGQLTVSPLSPDAPASSGITLLGTQVGLFGARLDASGWLGGGTIRIGGEERGQGTLPRAFSTYIDRTSQIRADGLGWGNGGRVIVWADGSTRVHGRISAQGGPLGGNGGLIETSGQQYLDVAGIEIAAAAPQGKAGVWLLDPINVTIRDTTLGGNFSGGNPKVFEPTTENAIVSTQDIATALNNGVSVTISTGTRGTQGGDIVVESPLLLAAIGNPTLRLEAANTITVNQTISSAGSLNLALFAGNHIALNAPIRTAGGNFTSSSTSLSGASQINPAGNGRIGSLIINNLANSGSQGSAQRQIVQAITQVPGPARENRPGDRAAPRSLPGLEANRPGQPMGQRPLQSGDPQRAEQALRSEFRGHLRLPGVQATSVDSQSALSQVQLATGVRPALVYVRFAPSLVATETTPGQETAQAKAVSNGPSLTTPVPLPEALLAQDGTEGRSHPDDQLELILVTADGVSIAKRVAGASRQRVLNVARSLITEVSDQRKVETRSYLAPAQQLYRWLIAPLESELQARQISNLAFISVTGLRFVPLAALHDGQRFLVQKYSVGLMPSLSLTDTRYVSLQNARVLAAGASTFTEQPPLPAVPAELAVITQQLWQGRSLLNNAFTLENLQAERRRQSFQIVHLATHGEFQAGALNNSYIQLWNGKLQLDQLRQLGWNDPPVELLVLSACQTALGSDEAELGFAGFALQAGVKSALASLWNISDEGTLAFMTEFYQQLRTAPIKAEALRRTQLAMVQGEVSIQGGQLRSSRGATLALPPELEATGDRTLSHPFYWAAFTLIGSPW